MLSLKKILTQILLQIKNLIDMDKYSSVTLTKDSGFDASTFKVIVYKYGGFCILFLNVRPPVSIAKNTELTMCTLPSDARPVENTYFLVLAQADSNIKYLIQIKTDGNVVWAPLFADTPASSPGVFRQTCVYPIAYRGTT